MLSSWNLYFFCFSGKASQRSKQKQRHPKMRGDINRKGAEKEGGTEMDAFVEQPPEDIAPPTPSAPLPSQPVSPAAVASTNKVTDNQIVKVIVSFYKYE